MIKYIKDKICHFNHPQIYNSVVLINSQCYATITTNYFQNLFSFAILNLDIM